MRVVLAEDSAVLREGLVRLLTARGHSVVGQVGDAGELASVVAEQDPDIVVVDVRMPPTHTDDGLRAALDLRRRQPGLAILVFSQYVETRCTRMLLAGRADGIGYLLKDRVADVSEFLDTLARVAAGGTVLDPDIVTSLMNAGDQLHDFDTLTPQERKVLALMAQGRSNTAIAKALHVSPGAVEKYVTGIFTKLDLPPSPDDHRRVLAVLRYLEPSRAED
ncbi:response regulator transcription factor [Phytohabitans kaempferiae]|uniref:Response regulator transcription factor n=1 Tax=Phytohabitans kaempferiae TaxID=1620943 RepID=A0ABV6MAE5_9ACTN